MKPGPFNAANLINEFVSFDMAPKQTLLLLEEIIVAQNWHEQNEAIELAEKWLPKFESRLQRKAQDENEAAQVSRFAFNEANPRFIQGSCFVEPRDSQKIAEAKKKRANCIHLYDALNSVSDNDFEKLCAKIITLWNVQDAVYTRASADQGIDFFGQVPFGEVIKKSAIAPGAEKQMKVWLVGQAKNYTRSTVSTKDIRELVGSVQLAKSKAYAGSIDPLAKLQMRSCDPVFFLFFTTGRLTQDALDLLKKAGVVAMDGHQLSVFLADHDIGIVNNQFDDHNFRAWAFGP
ncbi:restriction endonuclease [Roseibium sp.]|uniref:restriction endonuclease n=1 Tax=Roseibium sp. TaxID=1936156 RepID=UPI003BAD7273